MPAGFAQEPPSSGFLSTSFVTLSSHFQPPVLRALKIDAADPFHLEFIVDPGTSLGNAEELRGETTRLVNYFLASLTLPQNDLWVNLSPYEKNRIIPVEFGTTEMGRDLLAQDYLLKQITASLMVPEGDVGKKFWDEINRRVRAKYGQVEIPVNTLNKVWIVPDKAEISQERGVAYIGESHLKVLLESDYLALEKNGQQTDTQEQETTKEIFREIVLPVLEKEVNEGRNFALLRQVYHSLILAAWYKQKIKTGLLAAVYVDQKKVVGIDNADPQVATKIWSQYEELFRKGVYNSVKEELDPVSQEMIPHKYFMGGFGFTAIDQALVTSSGITAVQRKTARILAGVQLLSALPSLGYSQDAVNTEQAVSQGVVIEKILAADPRSAFDQQRKNYWLNVAQSDPGRVFERAAEFMDEPFAIEILKEAVRREDNFIYTKNVFRYARLYLEYKKGWEFFEWFAKNYTADFILDSDDFSKIKSQERVLEIIARFSPGDFINIVTESNAALASRRNYIRTMVANSSSERLQLIKAIADLKLEFSGQEMMGALIPMLLNKEMTLAQAQELIGDVAQYMKTLFSMLKNPAYASDRDLIVFRLIDSHFLSRYVYPTFYSAKWESAAIDAYLENFSAQELYYFLLGGAYGDLGEIVFDKLLQRMKKDPVNFYDVPEGSFSTVDLFMQGTSNSQRNDLMNLLTVEQQLSLVEKLFSRFERLRANNSPSIIIFNVVSDFLTRIQTTRFLPQSPPEAKFKSLVAKQKTLRDAFLSDIKEDLIGYFWHFRDVKDPGLFADDPVVKIYYEMINFPIESIYNFKNSKSISRYEFRADMTLLLTELVAGNLTVNEAALIVSDRSRFLRFLNAKASQSGHPSDSAVNKRLGEICMEFIRQINDLHEATNAVRFKSVERMSSQYLYRIMVYGEDEVVYTSTFNGLFDRFLAAMSAEGISADQFLDSVGYLKFRNFFRLAVTYGRQEEFLKRMSLAKREKFLVRFIQGLGQEKNLKEEAAIAADIIDQLNDPQLLEPLSKIIKAQYEAVENNREQKIIYGLLAGLFKDKPVFIGKDWFDGVWEQYKLSSRKELTVSELLGPNRENVQRYVFYDDGDAKSSFGNFIAAYKNDPNWRTIAYDQYVEITSINGQKVTILANKPHDIQNTNAAVDRALERSGKKPNILVHRGHSYHLGRTMNYLTPDIVFVGLGSCGGAKNIDDVLEKSHESQVLATKGVGTMRINDPLFKLINNDIRTKGSGNWESVWTRAEKQAWGKANEWAKYIRPDRNIVASFLKTYDNLIKVSASSSVSDLATKGGIDLNAVDAALQVNTDEKTAEFVIDPMILEKYKASPGFYPEIKLMRPVKNVIEYLTAVNAK